MPFPFIPATQKKDFFLIGDQDGVDTIEAYVAAKGCWFLKDDQLDGWLNVFSFKFGVIVSDEVLVGDWE